MKSFFSLSVALLCSFLVFAQDSSQIRFTYGQQRVSDKEVALTITAHVVQSGVKLFPLQKSPEDLVYSQVLFDTSSQKYLKGAVTEKGDAKKEQDAALQAEVSFIGDSVQWIQEIHLDKTDSVVIRQPGRSSHFRCAGIFNTKEIFVGTFLAGTGRGLFGLANPLYLLHDTRNRELFYKTK